MPFATRHRDDPPPELTPLPALEVHHVWDAAFMAALQDRPLADIARRIDAGHRAYVAWLNDVPAACASGAGIGRAGFSMQAEMSFDAAGQPALRAVVPGGGAAASRVLGIRETSEPLAPCWRCVRAGRGAMACPEGKCTCDYQKPRSGCAA